MPTSWLGLKGEGKSTCRSSDLCCQWRWCKGVLTQAARASLGARRHRLQTEALLVAEYQYGAFGRVKGGSMPGNRKIAVLEAIHAGGIPAFNRYPSPLQSCVQCIERALVLPVRAPIG